VNPNEKAFGSQFSKKIKLQIRMPILDLIEKLKCFETTKVGVARAYEIGKDVT